MDERLEMLKAGKTLTSSYLIKKIEKKYGKGVSFVRKLKSNYLDYVFISVPKNLDN